MEDVDKNGDGLIDLDEYIGGFLPIKPHGPALTFHTPRQMDDAKLHCRERSL